jgi:D-aminoacyl-tRNA deacylase
MILLVHSNRDVAGVNIAGHILKLHPFVKTNKVFQEKPICCSEINGKRVEFITLKDETVNTQTLEEDFPEAELIVFLSRHSSQSGTPTLSVHTPGNLAEAELGGLRRTVSVSPANAMQTALKALNRINQEMQLGYEVSYECTHHGPSLRVPSMFVELGSIEKQWSNQSAASAVAQATLEAIAKFENNRLPAVLGIGGTHYNGKFTRMALDCEAAFGHIIPKYAIPKVDTEILQQCIKRTRERVECLVLDWKGIRSEDKPKLMSILQETGLPVRKV